MTPLRLSFGLICVLLGTFSSDGFSESSKEKSSTFDRVPKLIITIVFDQLRADALPRLETKFLPPKNSTGKVGGFNFLTHYGAYYRLADHQVIQAMTGPGHAAILTGSLPYANGMAINQWYDSLSGKSVYCAEDQNFETVGGTDYPQLGTSPRQLMGTTLGDELKNSGRQSKVVSVAIKDRASIFLGGHRADLALWWDMGKAQWASSTYYLRDKKLPDFVLRLNEQATQRRCDLWSECTADLTIDAALALMKGFKLGRSNDPDLLAISFSGHDFVGHRFGPFSKEMDRLSVQEDKALSRFFGELEKMGFRLNQDVIIVLTGDHGAPPAQKDLQGTRLISDFIDERALEKKIDEKLQGRFGKVKDQKYLLGSSDFNFYFNHKLLREKRIQPSLMEDAVKNVLLEEPHFLFVFTKSEWKSRMLPAGLIGDQILKTYFDGRSGDVVALVKPYFAPKGNAASHLTGYSFDRMVPLVLFGYPFQSRVIPEIANIVDIAPTLSFLLKVTPPALSEGKILKEAIRPN